MIQENANKQINRVQGFHPGMDGIEILKVLRAEPATARIPVIMASAKGTEYDKVQGLDLGADDYLAKPFGLMEMVSRVKAVLLHGGRIDLRSTPGQGTAITVAFPEKQKN